MSEKRKASGGLVPEDVAEEKKVKGSPKAQDSGTSAKVDEKLGTVSLDNIEEDDEFQEFEVYSTSAVVCSSPFSVHVASRMVLVPLFFLELNLSLSLSVCLCGCCCAFLACSSHATAWDTAQAQKPDSLDFQDNWDEDANDKDFVAQLRKELSK